MCARARAKLINCFCPVDSPLPRSRMEWLETLRQRADEIHQVHLLGRGLHLFVPDAFGAQPDILLQRTGEQVRILQHHAEKAAQFQRVERTHVHCRLP